MTPEDKKLCERLNQEVELIGRDESCWPDTQDVLIDAAQAIERLSAEVETQRKLKEHWMANHDDMVHRLRIATQRPDLPVDRIPAIKQMEKLQEELAALKKTQGEPNEN